MKYLENRQDNLVPVIIAGIVSIVIAQIPYANLILYPFKMFVTYIHEASHGLMAIITGGTLNRFEMSLDASGLAYTTGGIRLLIVSAGYLGSAFWGSLLFIAAYKKSYEKIVLGSLSAFLLLFTVLFARNITSFITGLILAASIYLIKKIKYNSFISVFLAFLAIQTCFNSLNDIFSLLFLSNLNIVTDAHIISRELTGGLMPPIVFAVIWGLISLTFFVFAFKVCFKKEKRPKLIDL